MKRTVVCLALSFLMLAPSARAQQAQSHDLRQPCPAGYMKGGKQCDRLDRLTTRAYQVEIPSCPAGSCVLEAGAARVDITPPPGFPMGGNGFPAQFGRGYWSRLYARAFFFRDSRKQTLALVSCDLGAMSSGLQARVAELLQKSKRPLHITRDNLVLSATHVHHGPGNFMSFKLYNDMGSRMKGFDRQLFEMLASRIKTAVEKAEANAIPAKIVLKEGEVGDLLRNRAVEPFLLNLDRDAVLKDGPVYPCNPPGPGCPCPAGDPYRKECPRYRAVDPRISVLEIRPGGGTEASASLVFLSVHPEAMSHETQLYQSDFTGLAMALLEKDHNGDVVDGPYVSGFFNGAEGDISVRWDKQNRIEAVQFATSLHQTIQGKLKETFTVGPDAVIGLARAELSSNCYFAQYHSQREQYLKGCYGPDGPCISGRPLYGVATLGGAEDSRSPLFELGWNSGHRVPPRDEQGVKQGALESDFLPNPFKKKDLLDLTNLIGPPCYYPERIPATLARIQSSTGTLWLGAFPGEPTRTVWRRIEKALVNPLPANNRILPVGIANEYIGYVTTREEFAAQYYEGASNVFGPETAELLGNVFKDLASDLHDPVSANHRRVDAGVFFPEAWCSGSTFGPDGDWMRAAHGDDDEALENLIVDPDGKPERHWPRFQWQERGEGDVAKEWDSARFVEIVDASSKTRFEDERGGNILTVVVNPWDKPPDHLWESYHPLTSSLLDMVSCLVKVRPSYTAASRKWQAVWIGNPADPKSYYFRVTRKDGTMTCSEAFTVGNVMARDTPVVKPAPSCS
ncbi:MAG TPA: neutral/alkaline non-lysosomal ceramidase N-terminal domain-containing protein [Thermoanaerobaculia bacterium]|nr:neutral/alkaline non-lysosomal ceramidase N-terminal domain-containing protein [Thermoanaerobaculia bacterium]